MWLTIPECQKLYNKVNYFYGLLQNGNVNSKQQTFIMVSLLLKKLRLGEESLKFWGSFDHNIVGEYLKFARPEAGFLDMAFQNEKSSRLYYKILEEYELSSIKAGILAQNRTYLKSLDYEIIKLIYRKVNSEIKNIPYLKLALPWLEIANKKAELMLEYFDFAEKYKLGSDYIETFFTVKDLEFTKNSINIAESFLNLKKLKFGNGYKDFKERMAAEDHSLKALETTMKNLKDLPSHANMLPIDTNSGEILAIAVMVLENRPQRTEEERAVLKGLRVEIAEKTPGYPGYRREGSDFLALDAPTRSLLILGLDNLYNTRLQDPEDNDDKQMLLQTIPQIKAELNRLKLD